MARLGSPVEDQCRFRLVGREIDAYQCKRDQGLETEHRMSSQSGLMIYTASTWVIPVIIAITLHEAAHGFVAHQFGDETAWRLGRVTLNPFKHVDLFGTIILPAVLLLTRAPFLFGYAKPVPVNFRGLRNPRRDMVWVAAAGPPPHLLLANAAGVLAPPLLFLSARSRP